MAKQAKKLYSAHIVGKIVDRILKSEGPKSARRFLDSQGGASRHPAEAAKIFRATQRLAA